MTIRIDVPYGTWTLVAPSAMDKFLLSVPRRGEIAYAVTSGDAVEPVATVYGHVIDKGQGLTRMLIPQVSGAVWARSLVKAGSFVSRDPDA